MRLLSRVALGLLLTAISTDAAADFDPRGRKRPSATKPAPQTRPSTGTPKPATPRAQTPRAQTPRAQPPPLTEASEQSKGPSEEVLIARYQAILLSQPGAEFPLQRLAELYRKRDGNLDRLIAEFETRAEAEGPQQYDALVALGGVQRLAGRPERAIEVLERAVALKPKSSVAPLALGRLHLDRLEPARARAQFERALPLLADDAEREQVLRQLLKLCLDTQDLEAARKVHSELVRRAKGSFYVQTELGAELLQRGSYAEAEQEFRRLVQVASGDNRALAPALRDLGKALAKQDKIDEALTQLRRGLALTSNESGLRRELLDVMVEVYRDGERLDEVVTLLERERGGDLASLRLLGGLYEERGRLEDALATYRKALRLAPKDLDVRLRLVRLLQLQGELARAIEEYRALIQAAPHNPDFVFQLVDALLQQGARERAITELKQLEQRSRGDEQVQTALIDFYERVGESARSLALLEQVSERRGSDPQHLVELGDRYFREGRIDEAQRVWKRVLVVVPDKARARQILGEVYLEHDLPEDALALLNEAVELAPDDPKYKKSLARALERSGASAPKRTRLRRYEEALHLWQQLLGSAKADPRAAQEARRHIVTLWALGGTLEQRIAPLERNMKSDPPDLDSGRLLSQVYEKLDRSDAAERVLRRVVRHAPGDAPSHLALERMLVKQRKLTDAVRVLEKLVALEPDRAREYYQRMASYSAEMYQDDDAVRFAAKAVELSPDDAVGHRNLAEMYARRHDVERAIHEYQQAITKNDRLFPAYFELAELLVSQQRVEEADKLLRRVMRSAGDEELLARATRKSLQLAVGQHSLESLEKELLPLALSNPQKPIYRRLLVELYGALTFPLIQRSRGTDPEARAVAKQELTRIGQRAVKPLLDALADPRDAQQQVAIELLNHLRNPNANQALYVYATSEAHPELRLRAMLAAGATGRPEMLEPFRALVFEGDHPRVDEGDPVNLAAVWGICQIRSPAADGLLAKLLETDSPTAQALAATAASLRGLKSVKPVLRRLLDSSEHGNAARAAAAMGLGELADTSAAERLLTSTQDGDERVRAAALVALARLRSPRAPEAIAAALLDDAEPLRAAAVGAAGVLASGRHQPRTDPMATFEDRIDAFELVARSMPAPAAPDDRARAIVLLEKPLQSAIELAVQRSPTAARLVSESLLARAGRPAFGALSEALDRASPAARSEAEAALERIAASAVPPFVGLTSHPSVEMRTTAIAFLTRRAESSARDALTHALGDPDDRVRRLALDALSQSPSLDTLEAVVRLLDTPSWSQRVEVLHALEKFGRALRTATDARHQRAVTRVEQLARQDGYAFVREAAVEALVALMGQAARPVLLDVIAADPEARVRERASELHSRLE